MAAFALGCGTTRTEPRPPAHVIDEFGGTAVDPTRWLVLASQAGPDPFSVSDGRLRFSFALGGGTIRSTGTAVPGFYSVLFIRGWDPGGTTTFSADDVAYAPEPPPAG